MSEMKTDCLLLSLQNHVYSGTTLVKGLEIQLQIMGNRVSWCAPQHQYGVMQIYVNIPYFC